MQLYKNQNKGYQTLNLDGVLFMINDPMDELGQHYENKNSMVPGDLKNLLSCRAEQLNLMDIKYTFVIIPDKSVVMHPYLIKYGCFDECRRNSVNEIISLPFCIDSLDKIKKICAEYQCQPCSPESSYLNSLCSYVIYANVIEKLGLKINKYDIQWVSSDTLNANFKDLCQIENNGNRSLCNLQIWKLPLITSEIKMINRQTEKNSDIVVQLTPEQLADRKNRHEYVDIYINLNSDNDQIAFIYHDNDLAIIEDNKFIRKKWLASHFKCTYFMWSKYDGQTFKRFHVNQVIDCNFEKSLDCYEPCQSLFDKDYYIKKYTDISENPFDHFIKIGIPEGRFPNKAFEVECSQHIKRSSVNYQSIDNNLVVDIDFYRQSYKIVDMFINQFPSVTAQQFYESYGNKMDHIAIRTYSMKSFNSQYQKTDNETQLVVNFDSKYYMETYGKNILYPYYHYLNYGCKNMYSPNSWFDEKFYVSFYSGILSQIKKGELLSGFDDYLKNPENKICKYQLNQCLEYYHRGVCNPSRIVGANHLEYALNVPAYSIIKSDDRRVWLMLESFNPDIFFGGYITFVKFIESLIKNEYNIGIYLTSGHVDIINYYVYHHPTSLIAKNKSKIPVYSAIHSPKPFIFGSKDIFIAYSSWQVGHAFEFSKAVGRKFIFFIQEYEAIFHASDSIRFYVESCYRRLHYPLYHSDSLQTYFEKNRIGNFAKDKPDDYYTYNLMMCNIQPITKPELENKVKRRLLFYARPEGHAERNLFEIGYIALKRAIVRGAFKDWEFIGIGALNQYSVPLPSDYTLNIYAKTDQKSYCDLIRSGDVGLSLIFSPHPGLVHFEMAKIGMVVVVNTFSTRPKEYYDKISPRLLASDPTLDDIVDNLIKAEKLCYDNDLRTLPWKNQESSIDDAFTKDKLQQIFGALDIK